MDGRARMSGGGFRWRTFWMGDVMSFRLEKNHGTAGAIDRGQISVQPSNDMVAWMCEISLGNGNTVMHWIRSCLAGSYLKDSVSSRKLGYAQSLWFFNASPWEWNPQYIDNRQAKRGRSKTHVALASQACKLLF
ncbi:uncharacterized protein LOC124685960 isoform X1 [Lolium rigidum]|uniref:uncharacterized protein LOC124685960 isoform X1 n=1 Tax=Lolium rigidum TaxID=89674 RepID=UPI001F5D8D79|nr:uncharacterized protein LOC124685960 isoform X1 [Lolium rigidum]XP_047075943.1 uncharacterized protein LOC124685960 isoform X1 [Lolium rigidum]